MRRVEFTGAYPDDKSLFAGTRFYPSIGKYVGVYSGADSSISSYAGPWPVVSEPITIATIDWLRNELGETAEFLCRGFGIAGGSVEAVQVSAFIAAIDARINIDLILSDPQYKTAILLIESQSLIDQTRADALLVLGGHTR